MKAGFEKIDWAAPLDVDAYIEHCPPEAKIKGVIVQGVLKRLKEMGKPPPANVGQFLTFKDYPLREHMRLTVEVAKLAFPHEHLRESLRRLGQTSYPAVKETLIGKVVFSAFDTPQAVLKMAAKAYQIIGSIAQVRIVESGPRMIHTYTTNAYGFYDSFQVGTAEGVCLAFGRHPDISIKRHSLSEAELYLEW